MASSAGLLSDDILLLVFGVGELGQKELGRCGRVCRDWHAVHRAPRLWKRVLRSLCRSFGTDPFVDIDEAQTAATRSFIGVDDAWFWAHGLLYRSLQQQCCAWSERVGSGEAVDGGNMSVVTAAERQRARTIWDVLCCRSPLEHFQLQQRRVSQLKSWQLQCTDKEFNEAWKRDRSLHCGVWEVRPMTEPNASDDSRWRRVVPASGAVAWDVVAHMCMSWLVCQRHDLLARVPGLGYLWTPWTVRTVLPDASFRDAEIFESRPALASAHHLIGIRSGSSAGTSVQSDRATLDAEVWTTDLSAAVDCLLGLNPKDTAHKIVYNALARYDGHFFRLRSKTSSTADAGGANDDRETNRSKVLHELPAMCTWAPLASVLAHGGHIADNIHELTTSPQSVEKWRCSPKGGAALARAMRRHTAASTKKHHQSSRARTTLGTVFLQSVRVIAPSLGLSSHSNGFQLMDVHPDQIELLRVSGAVTVSLDQLVADYTGSWSCLARTAVLLASPDLHIAYMHMCACIGISISMVHSKCCEKPLCSYAVRWQVAHTC